MKPTALLLRAALVATLLLTTASAAALCPPLQSPDTLMNGLLRRVILGSVWRTIESDYLYRDFNGLDWSSTLARYRERIDEAETNVAFYRIVDDMIVELGDDHSIYLSPWEACWEDGVGGPPPEPSAEVGGVRAPYGVRLDEHPTILYLNLPSFDSLELPVVIDGILAAQLRRGAIEGIILDLRDNYGGYLTSAYGVLSNFVVGHLGNEIDETGSAPIQVRAGPHYLSLRDVRLTVLVNADTVSAAEIVAGALQQRRGAQVVGVATLGNTEMLSRYDFVDGSRLWLAVAAFTLPDGTSLEGRGVVPDAPVSVEAIARSTDDLVTAKAVAILLAEPPAERAGAVGDEPAPAGRPVSGASPPG